MRFPWKWIPHLFKSLFTSLSIWLSERFVFGGGGEFMGYKNAMDNDCESIYHSTTSFHRGQNKFTNIPPPTQNGSGFVFSFLETQKEHSVSLYSLSVTTAKPLVYSIFTNRHNYLNSKYNLNYLTTRAASVTVRWQMWQCRRIRRNNNWVSQYAGYTY